jgi:hypothetical protein
MHHTAIYMTVYRAQVLLKSYTKRSVLMPWDVRVSVEWAVDARDYCPLLDNDQREKIGCRLQSARRGFLPSKDLRHCGILVFQPADDSNCEGHCRSIVSLVKQKVVTTEFG